MDRCMRVLWFILMYVHALHSTPLCLVRTIHSDHLHLAVDGPAEGAPRDAQVHIGVLVPEPDSRVLLPVVARTDHLPVVPAVSLSLFVAVTRDLLVARQRRREVVRVQVLVRRDVMQSDQRSTGHRLSSLAEGFCLALQGEEFWVNSNPKRGAVSYLDSPVAVDVVLQLRGSD